MDHQTVQPHTTCLTWFCTPGNEESSMGIASGRHTSKQTPKKKACTVWILQKHNTPGLWLQDTWPILFTLVVDNIRVKYVNSDNVQHLIVSIKKNYSLTKDWTGDLYCGIKLEWDYVNRTVDTLMPGYVKTKL